MVFPKFVPPLNIARKRLTSRALDWHLLPCFITFHEVLSFLPGNLRRNSQETQPLSTVPWAYTPFVNRHVSPGTQDWSEGKLLCKGCVLKLMGRRILNSLRELKAQRRPSRLSALTCLAVIGPSVRWTAA